MTLNKARLVTKAELLRRVDRSRTRLYEDAKPGGVLQNALAPDGRIDLNHIDAVNYCHQYNYKEPDTNELVAAAVKAEQKKARAPKGPPTTATELVITDIDDHNRRLAELNDTLQGIVTPGQSADAAAMEFEDSDDKTAKEIMGMTLSELSLRYGKQAQFLDYVKALKVLTDTRAKDEDAARRRKEHVPLSLVLALTGQIDALQTALLSETTVAIRNKVSAMVKAGVNEKTIEKAVHDLISRTIRTTKDSTERAIRDVYQP